MTRTWFFQRMADDLTLSTMLEGGIHQSTSIDKAPHFKPFIMYRQTSDVPVTRGDDRDQNRQVGFMVFVHDIPGDYLRIDAIMAQLRYLFADVVDQPNGIISSTWIETSDDIRDEDMGTIAKYGRVLVKYRS